MKNNNLKKAAILIIDEKNESLSQMLEAFLKKILPSHVVYSAGIEASKIINPFCLQVMLESGIDIGEQYPKSIDLFMSFAESFDFVILFNNVQPNIPNANHYISIENSFNETPEKMLTARQLRDEVKKIAESFIDQYLMRIAD